MEQKYSLTVQPENESERLDLFISTNLKMTRSTVQKLIKSGEVVVNKQLEKANYKIKANDEIDIFIPRPRKMEIAPEPLPLNIVYEDDWLLVVNKPAGMVVHPAAGNYSNTLVNGLLYHCGDSLSGINGVIRPGIVHRIDKDTSGLLVVAKNDEAHQALAAQIAKKTVNRLYFALVHGVINEPKGIIDAPIGRDPKNRKKMAVTDKNSKGALTKYNVIERAANYTFIEAKLETGRTHQIRVHFKYIGHPVVGDPLYGPQKSHFGLSGQLLHAKTLGFIHPKTGENMLFKAPMPETFIAVLNNLNLNNME